MRTAVSTLLNSGTQLLEQADGRGPSDEPEHLRLELVPKASPAAPKSERPAVKKVREAERR
jgi:hypothetical protein